MNRGVATGISRSWYRRQVGPAAEDIAGYFDSYGWKYVRQEPSVFRTAFTGETGRYEVWLKVTDTWVFFCINPYVRKPAGQAHGPSTLHAVLRANHEVNLAKFAVDDDGDVSLSVELPADGFRYTHFCDALTALAHYADGWRPRIDAAVAADRAEVV
jgi:hypothetical protein